MDVLSDVLATIRLTSAIHICPEMSAPWGIALPEQSDRAVFYLLSRGSCYLEVAGQDSSVTLAGGDLAMLPLGTAHSLRDRLDSPAIPIEELIDQGNCDSSRALRHGG